MAIRTNYTAGEKRHASQVNEENQAIIDSALVVNSFIKSGATISVEKFSPRYFSTDNENISVFVENYSFKVFNYSDGYISNLISTKNTWADSEHIRGCAVIGEYFYLLLGEQYSNTASRIYRYEISDPSVPGIQMTESFLWSGRIYFMSSDGTDLFFNYDGAGSTNPNVIARAIISGTSLSDGGEVTHASTISGVIFAVSKESVYFIDTTDRMDQCNKLTGDVIKEHDFGYDPGYYGKDREVFILKGKMMYAEGYSRYNKAYTLFAGENYNL